MLPDHTGRYGPATGAILISGPVGGGKTEAAIDAVLSVQQQGMFTTVWVLLATGQQIHAFRERLLDRSPDAVQFGVEFFNFEALYRRLLDLCGDPQRQIQETARFQVLRHVTTGLLQSGELEHFGAIASAPGFIGLVAGLIHELKQGLVQPEDFARVAASRDPKDRDLARIYHAYQLFLQDHNLVDRHGAGWLAVHHLDAADRLPARVDLLVVDGFDQFNRVNAQLVTALARLAPATLLTLTAPPEEPGREFRRFAHTRDRLLELGQTSSGQLWHEVSLLDRSQDGTPRRAPALDHLVDEIFRSRPRQMPDSGGGVMLIEAPDVLREVRTVLRRVKRLLLAGSRPETIAIVARQLHPYSGILRETAAAYGVPLVIREGIPLRENPVIALLMMVVDLAALDFPRRELLDTLRSPYLTAPGLTPRQIAWIERISLDRQVVRGRESWLEALREAGRPVEDEDGELHRWLDPAEAAALADTLARYFDRITPPPVGTVYVFADWLQALIGPDPEARAWGLAEAESDSDADQPDEQPHLNVIRRIRAARDADRIVRDLAALRVLRRALAGLRAAHDLLTPAGDPSPTLSWLDFRAELALAIDQASVTPAGGLSRLGRVLATDVLEVRGLPHDHVFILGMAEGMFPAQEPEGALYQEGERGDLERAGIDMLTAAERSDELTLFYQAIGLARRSLTVSRFTVDDQGTQVPPSPYWDAVCAVVGVCEDQATRVPVGSTPDFLDAATLNETAIAVAAALSGEHSPGAISPLAGHNALLAAWGSRWLGVLRGRAIEAQREDPAAPFSHHDGRLSDPDLIQVVAGALGPERVWSASQFNDYGICPFRFFARRVLRLEELEEPAEGLDQIQIGSINHAILEQTYNQIAAEGLAIAPENQDRALAILAEQAEAVFASAPAEHGFRPSGVWEHEQSGMRQRLGWLVEQDFSGETPLQMQPRWRPDAHPVAATIDDQERHPFWQEAAFGFDDTPALAIDGAAGPLLVRGKIDRMDRAGPHVVVMDYKTGTAPHPVTDMAAGRDFQMMVYILAAKALLVRESGLDVAGGLFWHINNRKVSGEVLADDPAIEEARARLHAFILDARAGQFAVRPQKLTGGRCVAYCEFGALCRVNRAHLRKPSPGADLFAD